METFNAIKGRRSIRKYKKGAVIDKKTLEEIVETGKYAPSARAEYPWQFIIITEPDRIKELTKIVGQYGKFMVNAAASIVVTSKDAKYYLEDGSAATQNILLAAYAKGIGTCWIAGDKKDYCPKVMEFINAPAGYKLVSIISVGVPDEKPKKLKPNNSEIIHWEKFK